MIKTKFSKKANDLAQTVIDTKDDRVTRWKAVHKLLREQNKKARKEQDKVAEECRTIREEGIFLKEKSKTMGLRFGVSMPPTTWRALVQADQLVLGKSDLLSTDKEDGTQLKSSNQIVKDLEKAFPQYKVS